MAFTKVSVVVRLDSKSREQNTIDAHVVGGVEGHSRDVCTCGDHRIFDDRSNARELGRIIDRGRLRDG